MWTDERPYVTNLKGIPADRPKKPLVSHPVEPRAHVRERWDAASANREAEEEAEYKCEEASKWESFCVPATRRAEETAGQETKVETKCEEAKSEAEMAHVGEAMEGNAEIVVAEVGETQGSGAGAWSWVSRV